METASTVQIDQYEFRLKEHDEVRNGHVYCTICNERVDGEGLDVFGNKMMLRRACRCDREKQEQARKYQEQQQLYQLKEMCFLSPEQHAIRLSEFAEKKSNALRVAENYVHNFVQMSKDNIGLLFFGNVGTGKTFLACGIANALIEEKRMRVRMVNLSQVVSDLSRHNFDDQGKRILEGIRYAPLLIIDDFGMERDTAYSKEKVYTIVNERYLSQRPTIITTNLPISLFENEDVDVNDRRIYSRILEMTLPVRVQGEDYRKTKQLQKRKTYEALIRNGGDRP